MPSGLGVQYSSTWLHGHFLRGKRPRDPTAGSHIRRERDSCTINSLTRAPYLCCQLFRPQQAGFRFSASNLTDLMASNNFSTNRSVLSGFALALTAVLLVTSSAAAPHRHLLAAAPKHPSSTVSAAQSAALDCWSTNSILPFVALCAEYWLDRLGQSIYVACRQALLVFVRTAGVFVLYSPALARP